MVSKTAQILIWGVTGITTLGVISYVAVTNSIDNDEVVKETEPSKKF